MVKYEVIRDETSLDSLGGTDHLVRKRHWYGARFQMGMLILAGFLAMVCHHFLYQSLNGIAVDTDPILGLKLSQQVIVSAAGNAIASFGSFVLGTAVGIAFVQILWMRLRRKSYDIQHIDAMISCRSSPFSPAALRAWRAAWLLSAIAGLGSGMRMITIFTPGALRTTDSTLTSPCTVPMVDVSAADYGMTWPDKNGGNVMHPSPVLVRMAVQNFVSGSYNPPPNYLGRTWKYNTSFNSPAIKCTDMTTQFNFTSMFLNDPIIYNGTHNIGQGGSSITVASMEAIKDNMEATSCVVYSATYSVEIHHSTNTSTEVFCNYIEYHRPLNEMRVNDTDYVSTFTVALATAQTLFGVGQVDMRMMQAISFPHNNNPQIVFSALGQPGPTNSMRWKWNQKMVDAIPQLMTNISISLLSNPMSAPLSNIGTHCTRSVVVYDYDQYHLLLSYGSGILIALLCVVAGFWSIARNEHQEETLEFSRLLVAILSPGLLNEELRKGVRLKTRQDRPEGHAKFIVDSQRDHEL